MFKSLIAGTKTIGTLTAKATVASAHGVKVAGVATGKGTKKAALATGRGVKAAGHYVAEEYRTNKPVETFTYDQKAVDQAIRDNLEAALAQHRVSDEVIEDNVVIEDEVVVKDEVKAKRAQRVRKSQAKATTTV